MIASHYSRKIQRAARAHHHRSLLSRTCRRLKIQDERDHDDKRRDRAGTPLIIFADRRNAIAASTPPVTAHVLAIAQLKARLASAERQKKSMLHANVLARDADRLALARFGYADAGIDRLMTPDAAGKVGHSRREFANVNAVIRDLRDRIERLQQLADDSQTVKELATKEG